MLVYMLACVAPHRKSKSRVKKRDDDLYSKHRKHENSVAHARVYAYAILDRASPVHDVRIQS